MKNFYGISLAAVGNAGIIVNQIDHESESLKSYIKGGGLRTVADLLISIT